MRLIKPERVPLADGDDVDNDAFLDGTTMGSATNATNSLAFISSALKPIMNHMVGAHDQIVNDTTRNDITSISWWCNI